MEKQKNTLATIGTLVVTSQIVERMLNMLLTFVVQEGTPLTYNRLMQLDEVNRKKTLGVFVREMKKRASLEPTLDATLERFLKNRNLLIHHFNELPGNRLATENDLKTIDTFLYEFYTDLCSVLIFCGALLHAWTQQSGVAKDIADEMFSDDTNEWFGRIKAMSPIINEFIFAKNEEK